MGTLQRAMQDKEQEDSPPSYGDSKAKEAARVEAEPTAPLPYGNVEAQPQPQPQPQVVVTQQPMTQMMLTVEKRPWTRTICQCDCGTCIQAFFCHCCIGKDVAVALGDDGCMWCCLYCCFACWTPCFICSQRSTLRNRFNLQGDSLNDFILGCFCACCALAQMQHEVNVLRFGGGGGVVIIQQPMAVAQQSAVIYPQ